MSSRKRTHPDDDSTSSSSSHVPSLPPAVLPVLASREMFFSIPLRPIAVHSHSIRPLPAPRAPHELANTRLSDPATMLNGLQRASLTALLTILNDYFANEATTSSLTQSISDTTRTADTDLAALADTIDLGLNAFLAKRSSQSDTPVPDTQNSTSSTTAVPPKRSRVSKKSGCSGRSDKIRSSCRTRDNATCRLCNGEIGVSAHILPFSLRGRKTLDFWAFIAIFRGVEATAQLKAAALDPDPNNTDNIMNVIYLCLLCHALLDKPLISLIPQILEDPSIVFPYDPRLVEEYNVVVEFPRGLKGAVVSILQDDGEVKRMRPGHVLTMRTVDAAKLPLPHPLLLQLHAICSRIVVMRAAAGYPVLTHDDSDGETVFDPLTIGDDTVAGKECFGEFGGKDVARDPDVVVRELGQRRFEQEQLLLKLRGRGVAGDGLDDGLEGGEKSALGLF